jgi:protein involved in polysaccharide export with SLBB domain
VILAQVSAGLTTEEERVVTVDGKQITVQPGTQPATAEVVAAPVAIEAAPVVSPEPVTMPAAPVTVTEQQSDGFSFRDPVAEGSTRVIRVPYESLRNGDLRYNIVIKPYDLIIVPQPTIGEFYMGGHVLRAGVYSLTARKITLKQAVVSAGGFDNIAVPAQTEIVRRLPDDREIFVRVDLDKVWEGSQPDIFLRPNDIVNVGTTWWAPFIASARGGFRLTYGFGFLYDRNWGEDENNR